VKHPILPRGKELGLPLISGVLLSLSFPPFQLLLPPFVALVPFLIYVGRAPQDRNGGIAVRRASFWMGAVYFGTVFYWLFTALVYYTWLSLLGYLITVVVLSTFLALAGWAIHQLRAHHAVPFWISAPVFWTTAEWVQGHLGDLAFPWLGLGNTLSAYPALVGFADITGVRGVAFWLVLVNSLIAEWWLVGMTRRWPRQAAALALVLFIPLSYSIFRWTTLDTRPAARVLVVQPNIPEDLKLEREAAIDSSYTALNNLTRAQLDSAPIVQLVAWPETALPTFARNAPQWIDWAEEMARSYNVSLLYGAVDVQFYPDRSYDYYNAALFVNSDGVTEGTYRKHYLVPVVERVPYIPVAWMRGLRLKASEEEWRIPLVGRMSTFLRWFGGFGRGQEEQVFQIDGAGFGVMICYESIFAQLSRAYRRNGADFLVNITNDAWFGRERPWWSRTSALFQHPSHLVMRAIENRMGVARAANTGISMFVDPRGRVSQSTHLFEPATLVGTVHTTDGLTLYARFGDWPGWLSALSALGLVVWMWWTGRGRRRLETPAKG
jgi:apolipoprotein N-acyltransferase